MSAAINAVRALMLDGRPRRPREVIEATGLPQWPVRGALRRLCQDYANPFLLQLPDSPSRNTPLWAVKHRRRGGSFYVLNPNTREALGVTFHAP